VELRKAGGIKIRPSAKTRRTPKSLPLEKSHQISIQRLKLFKIALWDRKEADLAFGDFFRRLNMIWNYENFYMSLPSLSELDEF
jgi:hypothetical protein